ncbi:asparagine amidase a [Grosmannia clavigera kw1407]|uniref:Asparagine amidase a n=1 Tax=Grosmannia clavigera (strain kw1407 / UAMH 11150) TaxID=655863 RepID=F0XCM8_GROCL|nr:asparagine amidase a [Grosmannia clavigera kw1407]EFX04402.1 asparagine amidase a [Grosmannia clavigera kw1407]
MEETAEPLIEKRQKGISEAFYREAPSDPGRPSRTRWLLCLLLPLVLGSGLILVVTSRVFTSCQPPQSTTLDTESSDTHGNGLYERGVAATSATSAAVLENFQVAQPVLTPEGATSCSVVLMDHVFGYSYGVPFVGEYTPPSCQFNRVVMNFTVTSEGRQFDRLALMYLNDTEVWRTSTAEPVAAPGIQWVYNKDMTEYLSLWRSPQKIIFDLGNIVNDKYTGSFNTTLTATFFMSDVDTGGASPSDLIIPISARKSASNEPSLFSLPSDNATNTVSFPRNANRAVFSVSANGQADEEFWWSNVLQSDVLAFEATVGQFTGYSPFREVQVYIDGQLAGVQWPFPVVFTGGVVPGLHRPIVGIDVFDLREHEIDITPWLPVLCDGNQHTFAIAVAGLSDDGQTAASLTKTVASSWYVTGKIFVWLDDDADSVTTGSAPAVSLQAPVIHVSQDVLTNATGANETLQYTVSVSRAFSVHGRVQSEKSSGAATWSQALSFWSLGVVSDYGYDQVNTFSIRGDDTAVVGGKTIYRAGYHYPITCNTTTNYSEMGNLTLWADLDQGLELQVVGAAVFPTGLEAFAATTGKSFSGGSVLSTHFNGTALYSQYGDGSKATGYGSTSQVFSFGGRTDSTADVPLYSRSVEAVNSTVVLDQEFVAGGQSVTIVDTVPSGWASGAKESYAQAPLSGGTGTRVFMGRGGADPAVAVTAKREAVLSLDAE